MRTFAPVALIRWWSPVVFAAILFIILDGLSPELARAQSAVPSVTGVAITSDSGDDNTYTRGEVISVTLTFSEAVDVTGSPQLAIDMDPAEWGKKQAAYHSGGGSSTLTFTHTVVEPNISTQGIAVLANTLALTFTHTVVEPNISTQGIAVLANTLALNGGTIKSASSQTDADLSHAGLGHDSNHKVDWRLLSPAAAPTVAPVAANPTVSGVAVTSDAGSDDT